MDDQEQLYTYYWSCYCLLDRLKSESTWTPHVRLTTSSDVIAIIKQVSTFYLLCTFSLTLLLINESRLLMWLSPSIFLPSLPPTFSPLPGYLFPLFLFYSLLLPGSGAVYMYHEAGRKSFHCWQMIWPLCLILRITAFFKPIRSPSFLRQCWRGVKSLSKTASYYWILSWSCALVPLSC